MLKIIPVTLVGSLNKLESYALLDEGSTVTLINLQIARKLGLAGPTVRLKIKGLNDHEMELNSEKVNLQISADNKEFKLENIHAINNLLLPEQTIHHKLVQIFKETHGLQIKSYDKAVPTILLGQDYWRLIVSRKIRSINKGAVAASRTLLGWVLHRDTGIKIEKQHEAVNRLHNIINKSIDYDETISMSVDHELQKLVKSYFQIDALGVSSLEKTNSLVDRANKIMRETTKRVDKGWETGLLWGRDEGISNPNSKQIATDRLKMLEKKFHRNPEYAYLYGRKMQRLIDSGYAK